MRERPLPPQPAPIREAALQFVPRASAPACTAEVLLPVLIVLHQESSSPGRVGNVLGALGYKLDIRRPRFGDPLPDTLEQHAGAVIFGGPMSANDPDDFVRREIDWIDVPLRERKPFLGICLGAQMLAKQLGASVAPHPQGRAEIGYYPVRPTAAGLALCPDWPGHVYHWHREGFERPSGCELLAEGDDFPVQAVRYGDAYGLQFHPDVTYAMLHRWTTRGHDRMETPGARARHHHFTDRALHDVAERAWLKHFIARWLAPAPAMMLAQAAE
jgi:GMP synthase (glutamine-hydrolysing)